MLRIFKRLTGGWLTRDMTGQVGAAPAEIIALRCFGLAFLLVSFVSTFTTHPRPGLHGRGAVVLAGLVLLIASAVAAQPQRMTTPPRRIIGALVGVTVGAVVLAIDQPHGIWEAGLYFVAIIAAMRLDRRTGVVVLLASIAPFLIGSLIKDHDGTALSVSLGIVPWYLVMRMMRRLRDQHDALDASRAAEARAAAAAERGRLAREMHDVLAHSLSALALQLESTRMLARDHGVDDEVTRAIDQAHHLAATGLDDARRAIATARGDELPGPERIGALADAFGDQSGLPVAVEVQGEPRELAPDARLAVYRTAQEALTNVRRHAAPQRVQVRLAYLPDRTVLVVEDHAASSAPAELAMESAPADFTAPGTPLPAELGITGSGYGLTGMRERAKLLGGELLATPTADGFRVELRLPA